MKINNVLLIFISLFVLSCSDIKEIRNYDELGNFVSSYDMDGSDTLKKIEIINGNLSVSLHDSYFINKDTIYEYFKNGKKSLKVVPIERNYFYIEKLLLNGDIEVSGFIKDNRRYKWWNSYKDGNLFRKDYYLLVEDSLNIAESVIFQKNGLIDEFKSDYIDWGISSDTVFKGNNKIQVKFKKKGSSGGNYVCIGYDLNSKFNNLQRVKIDSFYSDMNNINVMLRFTDLGKKTIRGFIYEFFLDNIDNPTKILTAKRYFEKDFYIIPRPDSIPDGAGILPVQ